MRIGVFTSQSYLLRSVVCLLVLILLVFSSLPVGAISQSDFDAIVGNSTFFDPNSQSCSNIGPVPVTGGNLYLIGNSIGEGASSELTGALAGWNVTINAAASRSITVAEDILAQDSEAIRQSQVVIIELGANDQGRLNEDRIHTATEAIRTLNPEAAIFWVDIGSSNTDYSEVNQAIYTNSGPQGYTVINWFNQIFENADPQNIVAGLEDTKDYIRDDDVPQVHLTADGNAAFAQTIAAAVGSASLAGSVSNSLPVSTVEYFNKTIKPRIDVLEAEYKEAASILGIPWGFLAGIHWRESGNKPDTSLAAGEELGSTNPDHNEVLPSDRVENYVYVMEEITLPLARSVYGIELTESNPIDDYGYAMLAHNRGGFFNNVPPEEGGPWSYMLSPYVFSGATPDTVVMNYPDKGYMPDRGDPEDPRWDKRWGEVPNSRGKETTGIGALPVMMLTMGMTDSFGGDYCVDASSPTTILVDYSPNPDVRVDSAGRYPEDCTGGATEGIKSLADWLRTQSQWVPPAEFSYGYNCREIRGREGSGVLSVHGTGRALDVYLNALDPYEKQLGDQLTDWFIAYSSSTGVQRVIWNRQTWSADKGGMREYGGKHKHEDHIHVEINLDASNCLFPFYQPGGAAQCN